MTSWTPLQTEKPCTRCRSTTQLANSRARVMSAEGMLAGAAAEHALVRDSWMQRRSHPIEEDRQLN